MKKEIQALEDNGMWIVKPLPPDKKAIRCKWVFRIKYNADGTVERYKVRVVIHGDIVKLKGLTTMRYLHP